MKRTLLALVIPALATAWADDPVDLATHWETPPTEKQTLGKGDYTLSADYTLPVALDMVQGSTYDFSDGNKMFTVGGKLTFLSPFQDQTTILKGGAWNVTEDMSTSHSGTSLDGYKFILDGTTFSTRRVFFVQAGYAGDVIFALTNGATLNVTGDKYCEFCRLRTNDDPFLFDVSTGSKLNMSCDFCFAYTGGGDPGKWQNCTFRVRDAGTEYKGTTLTVGQYSPGYTVEVCDGGKASLTRLNMGQGGKSHDNTLVVRGAGSSFYVPYPKIGEQSASGNHATSNNWVYVLDGAEATLSTAYYEQLPVGPYSANNGVCVSNATLKVDAILLGKNSAAGSNNVFWVTGPDTSVKPGLSWPSHNGLPYRPFGAGPNCAIRVEDGAKLDLGNASKGTEITGTNCLVRVAGKNVAQDKQAHFATGYDFYLTGKDNRVEVLDGGKFSCVSLGNGNGGQYGCGNVFVVSNATYAGGSTGVLRLGADSEAASNNVFLATGPSTVLSGLASGSNPYRPFGAGPGCELRFEDGIQYTVAYHFDLSGTNCLWRVSGTNEVAQKRTYVDVRDVYFSGKGNTLEVSDGAYLLGYCCYVGTGAGAGGTDNTIILSNGHYQVSQYHGLHIKGKGNKLIMKGDRPRVAGPANFYLWDGAQLVFELPLGKTYDAANPPLGFQGYLRVDSDGHGGDVEGTGADPEILFPNIEEYRKSIDQPVTLQLGLCYTDARMKRIIRATAATLPKGCKLKVDEWDRNIRLTVKPDRGLSVSVR